MGFLEGLDEDENGLLITTNLWIQSLKCDITAHTVLLYVLFCLRMIVSSASVPLLVSKSSASASSLDPPTLPVPRSARQVMMDGVGHLSFGGKAFCYDLR